MSDLPVNEIENENESENINSPLNEEGRLAEHMPWPVSRRIRRALFCGYNSVLLVFVPIGIAAGSLGWHVEAVFVLNFLAIIPLAPLITSSIDVLSTVLGHTFGELLRPTSGNAVEMIVGYLYPNAANQYALF
jgi:Ca2+:H+ antiporter